MARGFRLDLPSPAIYHVTARGVAKCDIFVDDLDRERFIQLLRRVAEEQTWRCPAYTLMSNHYHVIVDTTLERLSVGMKKLNGSYAQRFNEKHHRVGHLFQGRFDARVIESDEHLSTACEYVWNNPVAVGLCATAADWPWSGTI